MADLHCGVLNLFMLFCLGLHIVGVGSPQTGKTLSYVIPILGQVMQPSLRRSMPKGIGVSHGVILQWKF